MQKTIRIFLILFTLCNSGKLAADNTDFDLQKAIDQASRFAIIQIPQGKYIGNFIITKPLTLKGQKGVVIDGNNKGTVLKVLSSDVTVEDLTIQNSGSSLGGEHAGVHIENSAQFKMMRVAIKNSLFGIRIMASPETIIQSCQITGKNLDLGRRGDGIKIWFSPQTQIINSKIHGVRDILVWYSDHSKIENNEISDSRYGLHYMYSHNNYVAKNLIRNNSVGIYDMYSHDLIATKNVIKSNRGISGYGFAAKESNRLNISDNIIINNRIGIHVDNSPIEPPKNTTEQTQFSNNFIAYNDVGITFVGPGEWTYFTNNDFKENWQQVRSSGSNKLLSFWQKNYWSDYLGFDREGNGFGSIPYRSVSIVDHLLDRKEALQLFRFSPVLLAVEFAERAFPWLQTDPRFIDQQPSMHLNTDYQYKESSKVAWLTLFANLLLIGFATTLLGILRI